MPSEDTNTGWTDNTWNGIHGCFMISEGCQNCYAARDSQRWGHTEHPWTIQHAEENIQIQDHHLDWPKDKDPRRIFVNSVSDLFLPERFVSNEYLTEIFDVMEECDQHVFQALTKHGTEHDQRLLTWDEEHGYWPDNLWMGVTVEQANRKYRIEQLKSTDAATKWVSFEPLIGPVNISPEELEGIDWVVIGGESGAEDVRREMDHAWAREIRDAAKANGIPVFFKQSSAYQPEQGRKLAEKGQDLDEAQSLGAGMTPYRELPPLPEPFLEERPELRDHIVHPTA